MFSRPLFILALAFVALCPLLSACASEQAEQSASQVAEDSLQPREQQAQRLESRQAGSTEPAATLNDTQTVTGEVTPLKIGLLVDFTGQVAEFGVEMQRGFELAIKHINVAGGVFGRPVEFVIGDTMLDQTFAVEEARRMIEIEGVHAIVGAAASSITLPLAESIAGPLSIPIISPSSQSRQITIANDNDFLFRVTPPSGPEAEVLAQLLVELGYDNVAVMARNDTWGQSFAEVFLQTWTLDSVRVDFDALQGSYVAELQRAASEGAQVLVLLTFPTDAEIMVRESIEQGIFDDFVFTAGGESVELIEAVGPWIAGMYGTAPTADPTIAHAQDWLDAFIEHFGEQPNMPFVRETYDATVAIAVAAQAAGSVDGTAIRDQLRAISDSPGEPIPLTQDGIARALELVGNGIDVDLEGVASSLAWDEYGDPRRAYIKIWQFTDEQSIKNLGEVLWEGGEVGDISGIIQR